MALLQARAGDLDELGLVMKFLDAGTAGVTHAGPQAAQHLEDGVGQRSLVGHAALNAFGHELLLLALK